MENKNIISVISLQIGLLISFYLTGIPISNVINILLIIPIIAWTSALIIKNNPDKQESKIAQIKLTSSVIIFISICILGILKINFVVAIPILIYLLFKLQQFKLQQFKLNTEIFYSTVIPLIVGVAIGIKYQFFNRSFIDPIETAILSGLHLDQIYNTNIAKIFDNYGQISIGINKINFNTYAASNILYSGLADFLKIDIVEIYNKGSILIIVPLMYYLLIEFITAAKNHDNQNIKYSSENEKINLFCLFILVCIVFTPFHWTYLHTFGMAGAPELGSENHLFGLVVIILWSYYVYLLTTNRSSINKHALLLILLNIVVFVIKVPLSVPLLLISAAVPFAVKNKNKSLYLLTITSILLLLFIQLSKVGNTGMPDTQLFDEKIFYWVRQYLRDTWLIFIAIILMPIIVAIIGLKNKKVFTTEDRSILNLLYVYFLILCALLCFSLFYRVGLHFGSISSLIWGIFSIGLLISTFLLMKYKYIFILNIRKNIFIGGILLFLFGYHSPALSLYSKDVLTYRVAELKKFNSSYLDIESSICGNIKKENKNIFAKNFTEIYNYKCAYYLFRYLNNLKTSTSKNVSDNLFFDNYLSVLKNIKNRVIGQEKNVAIYLEGRLIEALLIKSEAWPIQQLCNPTLFIPTYVTGLYLITDTKYRFNCGGFYGTKNFDNSAALDFIDNSNSCKMSRSLDFTRIYRLRLGDENRIDHSVIECNL